MSVFLREHRKLLKLLKDEAKKIKSSSEKMKAEAQEQAAEVKRVRKRPPVK